LFEIGSIEPLNFTFSEIYTDIHSFGKKMNVMEREASDLDHSGHDDVTVDYLKKEMRLKLDGVNDKVKSIDKNIEVFIAVHNFRLTQDFVPLSLQKRDSIIKKNRAMLCVVDPLMGTLPKDFEEERLCLLSKLREVRQKVMIINNVLEEDKVDAFDNERLGIYKKIEEATSSAKASKKKIEDLDEQTKKILSVTKETMKKDFHDQIEKLRETIFKMLKEIRTSSGPVAAAGADESTIKSLR
jgi:hypothetical protein